MHSPLPDSSALEAGIIEDAPPSRLSRVQDNVRNLLRSSIIGSVRSSPWITSTSSSPEQPAQFQTVWSAHQPDVLPSPTASVATTASTNSSGTTASTTSQDSADVLLPPASYDQAVRHMARQSAIFNTRAIAALQHRPAPSTYVDVRRRQRQAWKRSKRRELHHTVAGSQRLLCVIIGLALAGMLATCM